MRLLIPAASPLGCAWPPPLQSVCPPAGPHAPGRSNQIGAKFWQVISNEQAQTPPAPTMTPTFSWSALS